MPEDWNVALVEALSVATEWTTKAFCRITWGVTLDSDDRFHFQKAVRVFDFLTKVQPSPAIVIVAVDAMDFFSKKVDKHA
jgi:hypothetical protein